MKEKLFFIWTASRHAVNRMSPGIGLGLPRLSVRSPCPEEDPVMKKDIGMGFGLREESDGMLGCYHDRLIICNTSRGVNSLGVNHEGLR